MEARESHGPPFPLRNSDAHGTRNDLDPVPWEDSPLGDSHPTGWARVPSPSSAFHANGNSSLRDGPSGGILDCSPWAAQTQGKPEPRIALGRHRGTAPDPSPAVGGKSKRSHSRIRSRSDFSIKPWENLTHGCFTGPLTLLLPTASQPGQGGTTQPGTEGSALQS